MENRIMFFCNGGMDLGAEDFGRAMARLDNRIEVDNRENDGQLILKTSGMACGVMFKIAAEEPELGNIVRKFIHRAEQAKSDDGDFFVQHLKQTKSIVFAQLSDQLTSSEPAQVAFFRASKYLMNKGLGIVHDEMTGFMAGDRILFNAMLPEDEPPAKPTTEVIGQTPTGARILQHSESKPFVEAYTQPADHAHYEKIHEHVETWIGKSSTVYHEIVSTDVHIDVIIVDPTEKRPFYTLVTAGMSDRPMNAPPDMKEWRFAELVICLPAKWDVPDGLDPGRKIADEYFWPLHGLKVLARMPHKFNTFLCAGHTIGGEGDGIQIAPGLKFNTWLIETPVMVNPEFRTLAIGEHDTIHFWSVVPLYQEEADLKLKKGLKALEQRFDKYNVSELLDPHRPNTCKKKFGIF